MQRELLVKALLYLETQKSRPDDPAIFTLDKLIGAGIPDFVFGDVKPVIAELARLGLVSYREDILGDPNVTSIDNRWRRFLGV